MPMISVSSFSRGEVAYRESMTTCALEPGQVVGRSAGGADVSSDTSPVRSVNRPVTCGRSSA